MVLTLIMAADALCLGAMSSGIVAAAQRLRRDSRRRAEAAQANARAVDVGELPERPVLPVLLSSDRGPFLRIATRTTALEVKEVHAAPDGKIEKLVYIPVPQALRPEQHLFAPGSAPSAQLEQAAESVLPSEPFCVEAAEMPSFMGEILGYQVADGPPIVLGNGFRVKTPDGGGWFITCAHVLSSAAASGCIKMVVSRPGGKAIDLDLTGKVAGVKRTVAYLTKPKDGHPNQFVYGTGSDVVAIRFSQAEFALTGIAGFDAKHIVSLRTGTVEVYGRMDIGGQRSVVASRGRIETSWTSKAGKLGILFHSANTQEGFSGSPLIITSANGGKTICGLHSTGSGGYGIGYNAAVSGPPLRRLLKNLGVLVSMAPQDAESRDASEMCEEYEEDEGRDVDQYLSLQDDLARHLGWEDAYDEDEDFHRRAPRGRHGREDETAIGAVDQRRRENALTRHVAEEQNRERMWGADNAADLSHYSALMRVMGRLDRVRRGEDGEHAAELPASDFFPPGALKALAERAAAGDEVVAKELVDLTHAIESFKALEKRCTTLSSASSNPLPAALAQSAAASASETTKTLRPAPPDVSRVPQPTAIKALSAPTPAAKRLGGLVASCRAHAHTLVDLAVQPPPTRAWSRADMEYLETLKTNTCPVVAADAAHRCRNWFLSSQTARWAEDINTNSRRYADGAIDDTIVDAESGPEMLSCTRGYASLLVDGPTISPADPARYPHLLSLWHQCSERLDSFIDLKDELCREDYIHPSGYDWDDVLALPFMRDFAEYVGKQRLQPGTFEWTGTFKAKGGERPHGALRHLGRHENHKGKVSAREDLLPEDIELLKECGFDLDGVPPHWVSPPLGHEAALESLVAQFAKTDANSRMDNVDVSRAVGFTSLFPTHIPPPVALRHSWRVDEDDEAVLLQPGSLRAYVDKLMDEVDGTKSAGYTAVAMAGISQTKGGFLATAALRTKVFNIMKGRILVRLLMGNEWINRMTPAEMFFYGLRDPHVVVVKSEPHTADKAVSGRWRVIWVQSLIDNLVQSITCKTSSKQDIASYQLGGLNVVGPGMGHDDTGIARTGEVLEWLAEQADGAIGGWDASGWDLSVTRDSLYYDCARRIDTLDPRMLSGVYTWRRYEVFRRLMIAETACNSAHTLLVGQDVFEVGRYGITASGVGTTSSQNSSIRAMQLFAVTGRRVHANGDDALVGGPLTTDEADRLRSWGVVHKGSQEVANFTRGDEVSYTSHAYKRDVITEDDLPLPAGVINNINGARGFQYTARYLNASKMAARLVLAFRSKKGKKPSLESLGGLKYAVRRTPDGMSALEKLCEAMGWKDEFSAAVPHEDPAVIG